MMGVLDLDKGDGESCRIAFISTPSLHSTEYPPEFWFLSSTVLAAPISWSTLWFHVHVLVHHRALAARVLRIMVEAGQPINTQFSLLEERDSLDGAVVLFIPI